MHSLSINLGKQLKGHSNYLRWFLEEHPSERECLLRMYPLSRRWLIRLILSSRWVALLETEINMAAALTGVAPKELAADLRSISEAYQKRPVQTGFNHLTHRLLSANPLRLSL